MSEMLAPIDEQAVLDALDFTLPCRIQTVAMAEGTIKRCEAPANVIVACRNCGVSTTLCQRHADVLAALSKPLTCSKCNKHGRSAEILTFTPIGA